MRICPFLDSSHPSRNVLNPSYHSNMEPEKSDFILGTSCQNLKSSNLRLVAVRVKCKGAVFFSWQYWSRSWLCSIFLEVGRQVLVTFLLFRQRNWWKDETPPFLGLLFRHHLVFSFRLLTFALLLTHPEGNWPDSITWLACELSPLFLPSFQVSPF